MTDEAASEWIVIRNWDRFQHYKDRWSPEWVKFYPSLLHDPNFTELAEGTRLLLCQLFLVYASARAQVPLSTRWLSRQLSMRVTSAQLETLNHAGWIEIHSRPVLEHVYMASSPRALARTEAEEEEKEKEQSERPSPLEDRPAVATSTQDPGRIGRLARAKEPSADLNHQAPAYNGALGTDSMAHALRLIREIRDQDKDERSGETIMSFATRLEPQHFDTVLAKLQKRHGKIKNEAAYAVAELKRLENA